jgi:hypothetical protein
MVLLPAASGDILNGFSRSAIGEPGITMKYDLLPAANGEYKFVRGTKRAQNLPGFIELIQVFALTADPHNLKVIGSNPIPATKLIINPSNLKGLLGFISVAGIDPHNIGDLACRFKSSGSHIPNRIRAKNLAGGGRRQAFHATPVPSRSRLACR